MKRLPFALLVLLVIPLFAYADTFSRPLVQGNSGADVTALQQILITQGLLGSDSATGYFGALTAAALAKFQTAHGIEALGGVGPLTRALLNSIGSGNTSVATTPPPSTAGAACAFTVTRPLALGSSGADVTQLQQTLVTLGFLHTTPTGYFGALTTAALKVFQQSKGLEQVGSVGPKTKAAFASLACASATTQSAQPSTGTVLGTSTPVIIQNYTPPAPSGGGSGGGGGGGAVVNSTPSIGGGSNNTLDFGTSPFASNFTSGALSVPAGDTPSSASQVNVNVDTTVTTTGANGTDSVKLKGNSNITKSGGGSIDVTSLTTSDEDPATFTLPSAVAGEAALQFGIPGTALSFTQPVTVTIAVSPSNNGDTLNIYRSESIGGPWVQTSLVSTTCVVANGLCQFDTTQASHFVATRLKPTVTISAAPTSLVTGNSSTLTWASANATSCSASGSWSGSKSLTGSQVMSSLTANQTYTITCSAKSNAGKASASASVTITGAPADTTAPSAPTSLIGNAGSQTQITLSWTASTDDVGVVGYRVFRDGTQVGTPTGTTYSDTGRTANTAYTYTVKAVDAAGNLSVSSNSVSVTTLALAPTITISASPTSITSGGNTTVTWSSTNATSCTGSGAWTGAKSTSGSQTFTNLTANQTYTLQCAGTGGTITQSASVAVTTPVDTTPPTVNITGPVASLPTGTTQTTLTATTNEAATCRYSTDPAFAFTNGTLFTTTGNTSHSTAISGLQNSTSYTYYVKCSDSAGNISGNASVTFGVTAPADTTPPSVTITAPTANLAAGTTQTTLSVTTNENATCRYSTTSTFAFASGTVFSTTGVTSHSTTIASLQNSTTYTYYVKCQDTAGNTSGNASVTFSVLTPPDTTAPSTPTSLSATAVSSSGINLNWTASTDNIGVAGYQVFRNLSQIATTTGTSYGDLGLAASTLYSYLVKAFDAAGNVSAASTAASATTQAVTTGGGGTTGGTIDAYGTTWKPLKIGAGGYITNISIAPDGTKVIRTDTYGGYLWTGSQWQQLVTSQSMPAGDIDFDINAMGVYEIVVAPSNSNRFYMIFNGYLYRSDNKGTTWTKTAFTHVTDADANAGLKVFGPYMAVDPQNPDIVYAGTPSNGLWVSNNAGASFSQVTAVGTATNQYGELIVFDPTSSVVGGKKQGIYVSTYGSGVYHSTDGGTTWTKTAGTPTTHRHMIVDQLGRVWLLDNDQKSTSNLNKYAGGVWSVPIAGTDANLSRGYSIVVDPNNSNKIIMGIDSGEFDTSSDGGATWSGFWWGTNLRVASDIPWLAWTKEDYMSNGNMAFDPSSGQLYFVEGIGVWKTTPPNSVGTVTWTSQNTGIEQLVADEIISPPGGQPVAAVWDRGAFYIANPDVYPSTHGPARDTPIRDGWAVDWASSNPSFIAGLFNLGTSGGLSGYSTNGGQTWTQFPSAAGGDCCGGAIAAASPTNMVWIPSNNGFLYYTQNGGTTWTLGTMPGAPTSGESGWSWAYYLKRHIVAADRVNIGTFYAYNYLEGLYRSTNGGTTWTLVKSGQITSFSSYNAKLRTVPGKAGNLFFTGGDQSPSSLTNPAQEQFMRSTDGGVTWTAVPNVLEVFDFGFGAPQTTGGYPTIYIVGFVNNQYGVWRSTDNAASWTQVGKWPYNSLDQVVAVSGDMNIFGRVYIGFLGSGYVYGDTTGATPPPSDTTAPSTPTNLSAPTITSSQVSLSWTASTDNTAVAGYNIYRNGAQVSTSATNSYTDSGLTAATDYTYTVSAYDAAGNASAQSTSIIARTATITAPPPTGGGGGGGGSGTFVSTASNSNGTMDANFSNETFAAVNIGTPAANRIVVVGVAASSAFNTAPTSVTIGGIAATKAVGSQVGASSGRSASIWYATVPSGTTATIVVSQTGNFTLNNADIAVGTLTSPNAAPLVTATANFVYSGSPNVLSITPPTNSVTLIMAAGEGESGSAVITNATNYATMAQAGSNSTGAFGYTTVTGSQTHALSTFDFGGSALAAAAWGQ